MRAVSTHEINHLLEQYGYAFVFAIAPVILAGALGGAIGSTIGFAAGRYGGWTLLKRYCHRLRLTPDRLKIGRYVFARHGGKRFAAQTAYPGPLE